MLARLEAAVAGGDVQEVRKVVHWLKGGLTYLFSPAAERVWQQLDEASRGRPLPDLDPHCQQLRRVLEQLEAHFRPG